jgi:lysophospholipase L1-like esterase
VEAVKRAQIAALPAAVALAVGLAACSGDTAGRADPLDAAPSRASTGGPSSAVPLLEPGPLAGRYEEYVALGDSFTAGPLVAPQAPDGAACGRSLVNYPHLLARRLSVVRFRDRSCSGATTMELTEPQSNFFGTNPPQFQALRPTADLVTLGIGGNDGGLFGRMVLGCARVRSDDPTGSPCADRLGAGGLNGTLGATTRNVTNALEEIRRRSPDADIVLVGYPRITPRSGTCPDVLPYADGDYALARQVEDALNAALRGAAESAGVPFVDVAAASVGHDACAGDEAWVNGRETVRGEALSYHPFASGMAAVAELVEAQLDGGA